LFVLTPAAASAGISLGTIDGVSYDRATEGIAAGGTASPIAECPAGTKVVGVGGDARAGSAPNLEGSINVLRPDDSLNDTDSKPDDLAHTFLLNPSATGNTAASYAFCAAGRTKYEKNTVNIKPASAKSAKLSCPDGMSVTGGGGFIFGPAASGWLFASHPFDGRDRKQKPDDGWKVSAFNDDELEGTQMIAYAICRPGRHVYCSGSANVDAGDAVGAGASCSSDRPRGPVLSVGSRMYGANPSGLHLAGLYPADNTSQGEPDTVPDDYGIVDVHNRGAVQADFDFYSVYERP
jgi:hypothetical protein